jgi:ribosomal protein S12 methylthiotransferase
MQFDRLGVFTYSIEDGTTAEPLGDPIPQEEKIRRQARLMEIQQDISFEKNQKKIGSTLRTIIEKREDGHYIGRTEADAPEVDNEVIVSSEQTLEIGSFQNVKITDAYEFDLVGEVA